MLTELVESIGVGGGIRTLDHRNHNPVTACQPVPLCAPAWVYSQTACRGFPLFSPPSATSSATGEVRA